MPISLDALQGKLSATEALIATGQKVSQDYFLFLLGTDTNFQKVPTVGKRDYERGETLSYSAMAITALLDEAEIAEKIDTGHPTLAHSYSSPSVDVLNGPETIGTLVDDRIAKALYLTLNALASGKKTLNILAHSRGSVEGILLIHELNRIKQCLNNSEDKRSFHEILCDSPCAATKAAMQGLFAKNSAENEPSLRAQFKEKLAALEIKPFLIDPVPGRGIRYWHDARFYEALPGVEQENCELLVCRDERTNFFEPVLPEGLKPTIIPGHHGSASGNAYTQQKLDIPGFAPGTKAIEAQNLVLCKLFHFLNKTRKFPARDVAVAGHEELNEVLSEYLKKDETEQLNIIVSHYDKAVKQDPLYRAMTKTSYPWLSSYLGKSGSRSTLVKGKYQDYLDTAGALLEGRFLNLEHRKIYFEHTHRYLREQLGMDVKAVDELQDISARLIALFKEIEEQLEAGKGKIKELLYGQDENQVLFLSYLSTMFSALSNKFLKNHLNVTEKETLMSTVTELFRVASVEVEDATVTMIQMKLKELLITELIKTVQERFTFLTQQVKYELYILPSLERQFQQLKAQFLKKTEGKKDEAIVQLRKVLAEATTHYESIEHTIEQLKKWASDDEEASSLLTEEEQPQVRSAIKCLEEITAFHEKSAGEHFAELKILNDEFQTLVNAKDSLETWAGRPLIDLSDIHACQTQLGVAAGEWYHQDEGLISAADSGVFFDVARTQAKGFASDGLLKAHDEAHTETIQKQQLRASELQKEKMALEQALRDAKSPVSIDLGYLIQKQLRPLVLDYMAHLNKSTQRDIKDELLTQKKGVVQKLLDTLNHPSMTPQEKVEQFSHQLSANKAIIKAHRDSMGVRFLKACASILALLATGIIPGLIYSQIKNRSPLFFVRSHGDEFVEKTAHLVPKVK